MQDFQSFEVILQDRANLQSRLDEIREDVADKQKYVAHLLEYMETLNEQQQQELAQELLQLSTKIKLVAAQVIWMAGRNQR